MARQELIHHREEEFRIVEHDEVFGSVRKRDTVIGYLRCLFFVHFFSAHFLFRIGKVAAGPDEKDRRLNLPHIGA